MWIHSFIYSIHDMDPSWVKETAPGLARHRHFSLVSVIQVFFRGLSQGAPFGVPQKTTLCAGKSLGKSREILGKFWRKSRETP